MPFPRKLLLTPFATTMSMSVSIVGHLTPSNYRRFAQNEFAHGSVERGRSVFEGLMASYPKRLDLWNVYVDKEIKSGDIRAARNLLERLVRTMLCNCVAAMAITVACVSVTLGVGCVLVGGEERNSLRCLLLAGAACPSLFVSWSAKHGSPLSLSVC